MRCKTQNTKFALPPLPYDKKALEPFISEETLNYHHGKHLSAYIAKLNELITGTEYASMSLEQIVLNSTGSIFNNAAQTWNHDFYFEQFAPSPSAGREPSGALKRAIEESFGGVDKLRERLTSEALALFGSGWVWLAQDGEHKLSIHAKPNAGNPITEGLRPLLAIDVWEHAYYIDHRNARAEGIKAFWEVLDWGVVRKRMER